MDSTDQPIPNFGGYQNGNKWLDAARDLPALHESHQGREGALPDEMIDRFMHNSNVPFVKCENTGLESGSAFSLVQNSLGSKYFGFGSW
jgi:hypothetical protein